MKGFVLPLPLMTRLAPAGGLLSVDLGVSFTVLFTLARGPPTAALLLVLGGIRRGVCNNRFNIHHVIMSFIKGHCSQTSFHCSSHIKRLWWSPGYPSAVRFGSLNIVSFRQQ